MVSNEEDRHEQVQKTDPGRNGTEEKPEQEFTETQDEEKNRFNTAHFALWISVDVYFPVLLLSTGFLYTMQEICGEKYRLPTSPFSSLK